MIGKVYGKWHVERARRIDRWGDVMYVEPGSYYWVKSIITEDADRWEIAFIDHCDKVWIFGISGWFEKSEIRTIGPIIDRPDLVKGVGID